MIFFTAKEEEAKIHDPAKLTKLDSKRPSYATLDHLSELSRDLGKPLDLILMDGTIKTVQKEYIEEGGMIFEDMRVDSIPSYLEKHLLEEVLGEFGLNYLFRLFPIISVSQKFFSFFFLTLEKIGIDEKVICYHNISN